MTPDEREVERIARLLCGAFCKHRGYKSVEFTQYPLNIQEVYLDMARAVIADRDRCNEPVRVTR